MLPGMDGTGELFSALVSSCPPGFEPIRLRYAPDRFESAEDLLAEIDDAVPPIPTVLVAESFSGGVAIRFAAQHPQRVKALVLCNAFVDPPAPSIALLVPWSFVMRFRPSPRLVRRCLVGAEASPATVEQVCGAIRRVRPRVLAYRLRAILTEDSKSFAARLNVPVLYLRGTEDAIVSGRAVRRVLHVIPAARLAEIAGPHLLLQTKPEESWAAIQRHGLSRPLHPIPGGYRGDLGPSPVQSAIPPTGRIGAFASAFPQVSAPHFPGGSSLGGVCALTISIPRSSRSRLSRLALRAS